MFYTKLTLGLGVIALPFIGYNTSQTAVTNAETTNAKEFSLK